MIKDSLPNSFQPIELYVNMYPEHAMDAQSFYVKGEKLFGVDVATLEIIKEGWFKDQNHVYYRDQRACDTI